MDGENSPHAPPESQVVRTARPRPGARGLARPGESGWADRIRTADSATPVETVGWAPPGACAIKMNWAVLSASSIAVAIREAAPKATAAWGSAGPSASTETTNAVTNRAGLVHGCLRPVMTAILT
jgi:hypothetical protein